MQISKSVIKSVFFCITLVLCVWLLNFLLVPYSSMMRRFRGFRVEQEKGNVDVLVIGSSHEFDSFDTEVMDSELGKHCAVFAPQGGNPETSYYCLNYALTKNDIKTVIIGFDLLYNFEYPYNDYPSNRRAQMYREMLSDCFYNSLLRRITIKEILNQRYTMTFFEYAAFPENATNIKETINSRKLKRQPWKQTEMTSDNRIDENDIYNSKYELNEVLSQNYTTVLNDSEIEFIKKTRDLCKEKGIDLYYICCPYPDTIQKTVKDYSVMAENTKEMFKSFGVGFIDTHNDDVFTGITRDSNYHDYNGHFVLESKRKYTKIVCELLKNK